MIKVVAIPNHFVIGKNQYLYAEFVLKVDVEQDTLVVIEGIQGA